MRILISGASGPIGAALLASFESAGNEIVRLVRGRSTNAMQVTWNPMAAVPPELVSGFDTVIHLSGESVVGRWSAEKKKAIVESRVAGTRNLAVALSQLPANERPRVFISASAIGFYGDRGDEILTEESAAGSGFAADLGRGWEASSRIAADAGIRTVNPRIGLVLSAKGGALEKMLLPFKVGLGGRLGSGQQWWSWIHVDDIVGAVHHIMRTELLSGPVNFVAPGAVRNVEFKSVLAAVLGRPAIFPVPVFAAKLAFGEMAKELMLTSQRVAPAKLAASGYVFRYPELRGALESLV